MMVVVSDTYDFKNHEHLNITGLIGVFDSEEKAIEAVNEILREIKAPDWMEAYCENGEVGVAGFSVNENGVYDEDHGRYHIQIFSRNVNLNERLRS